MAYAKYAQETDKPWEHFQELDCGDWFEMAESSFFDPDLEYRLKPKTIRIGDYDVPEPVREPLELDADYWVVDLSNEKLISRNSWDDHYFDRLQLELGIIHLDPESAELHARALVALTAK
ncbi:hypothetical protein ID856_17635 [Xenorhabdus sp. 18]|nr:hypothetical protein [Xenorhabdus sp. 18]